MKSSSESATVAKNDAVPPPDSVQAPSKRRRTSPWRVDRASSPALTGRRAPHDRSTAAVNRTPALRAEAPRPAGSEWIQEARSDRLQELPNIWFSVITVHGDGRATFVTRYFWVMPGTPETGFPTIEPTRSSAAPGGVT